MMWFVRIIYVTVLCVIISITQCDSKNINDKCEIESGSNGICVHIEECPSALELVKNGDVPKICSFQDHIVCCQLNENTTATQIGGKSRRACQSYRHLGKNISYDQFGNRINVHTCHWKSDTVFLAGTSNASIDEFPHMALLVYKWGQNYAFYCSGALISEKFVLTLAMCLNLGYRRIGIPDSVRLGNVNSTNKMTDQYVQEITVKERYQHPNYVYRQNFKDNVGLIELERPAKINLFVKPACLHLQDTLGNLFQGTLTGWRTNEINEILLKSIVDVFPTYHCDNYYKNCSDGYDSNKLGCYDNTNSDNFKARTGSPIQIQSKTDDCSYEVFGMILHARVCENQFAPVALTKIYPYIEWIESVVWQ